jgi:hypothetical protein
VKNAQQYARDSRRIPHKMRVSHAFVARVTSAHPTHGKSCAHLTREVHASMDVNFGHICIMVYYQHIN